MRKVISLLVALVLCLSIAAPVFAAEGEFVPSISYKPNPEIVPVIGEDGNEYVAVLRDKDGNIVEYIPAGCLQITPVASLWDGSDIDESVKSLLTKVYNGINDNTMQIPYEKHGEGVDASTLVIRDLFDIRWVCEDHPKMMEENGYVLEITFDLGVAPGVEIYIMTYDEEADDWDPIASAVNNSDGTVTCQFAHFCAVEISMRSASSTTPPAQTGDVNNIVLWVVVMALAAGAGMVTVIARKRTV